MGGTARCFYTRLQHRRLPSRTSATDTARTVLVVETDCELDPSSPHYSAGEIARLTNLAREQWVKQFGPVDVVRLEQAPEGVAGMDGGRRIAS